jgi:hypothetical protein
MFRIDRTQAFRRKLAEGKTYDEALAELRAEGVSIIECIGAVREFRNCELAEAKMIVHSSPAWSDMVEPLYRELEELAENGGTQDQKAPDR